MQRVALAAVVALVAAACGSPSKSGEPTTTAVPVQSSVEVPSADADCSRFEGVVSSGVVDLPPGHPCRLDGPTAESGGPDQQSEAKSFVLTKHAADTSMLVGRVSSLADEEPIAGVTIVVTGPALQGTESAITEADGSFEIEGLPAGDYVITFYYADVTEKRPIEVRNGYQTQVAVSLDVGTAPFGIILLDAPEGMLIMDCWR